MNTFYILVLLASVGVLASAEDACSKQSQCYCQRPNGNVVDLQPLGVQRFHVSDSAGSWVYDFDPCKTFDLKDPCKSVVACQSNPITNKYNAIGKPDKSPFVLQNGKLAIKYQAGQKTSIIMLTCDTGNDTLSLLKEDPVNTYNFELKSQHACEAAPGASTTAKTTVNTKTTTTPKMSTSTPKKTTGTTKTTKPATKTTTPTPKTTSTPKGTKTTPKSTTPKKTTKPTGTTGTTKKPTGTTKKPTGTTKKPTGTTKKPTGTTKKPTVTTMKTTMTTQGASAISSMTVGALLVVSVFIRKLFQ